MTSNVWGRWHTNQTMRYLSVILISLISTVFAEELPADHLSEVVPIRQEVMAGFHQKLMARIETIAGQRFARMNQPGLAGVLGGVNLKVLRQGEHEFLLPIPQSADHQVPLCYFIKSEPKDAVLEYGLSKRGGLNDVLRVKVKGDQGDTIEIEWSSIVLISDKKISPDNALADAYSATSPCAQSDAEEIKKLAEQLWLKNKSVQGFAANIQTHIRGMKPKKQPRKLDALELLECGMNGICTSNANLAVALLRSKGIKARSMAVVPTTSQRLEMHRIVEYVNDGSLNYFDPSMLHPDIPMKPWQTVIMVKSTMEDEKVSMKPRMGVMLGCPYAQELEFLTQGISFANKDFFWTESVPLSPMNPDANTTGLAKAAWDRYLKTGKLSEAQLRSLSAFTAEQLTKALEKK